MQLEVKGLCQRFDESEILKDIDLGVKQGEVFVIIGPTGCGKTTLLRIIGLLDKPTSGKINFGGHEIADSESARLDVRRKLAIVYPLR